MANPNWKKGVSGNPNGRPPKGRDLTGRLEKQLSKTVEFGGKRVALKSVIPQILSELIATGRVKLGTREFKIDSTKELLDWFKFIYAQVDGAPKGEFEGDLTVLFKVLYDDDRVSDNPTETA